MISKKEIICPENLLRLAKSKGPVKAVIVNAVKLTAIESAKQAVDANLITPIFIGDKSIIEKNAKEISWDISKFGVAGGVGDAAYLLVQEMVGVVDLPVRDDLAVGGQNGSLGSVRKLGLQVSSDQGIPHQVPEWFDDVPAPRCGDVVLRYAEVVSHGGEQSEHVEMRVEAYAVVSFVGDEARSLRKLHARHPKVDQEYVGTSYHHVLPVQVSVHELELVL